MLSRFWAFLGQSMQSIPTASILRERVGLLELQLKERDSKLQERDATIEQLESEILTLQQQLRESQQESKRLQSWIDTLNHQIGQRDRAEEEQRDSIPGADVGL
jgi:septal ring factor EnvC (AmiA/AmiB activator)